jgi:hypothetical protein
MPLLASSTQAMLVDFSFMHLCSATLTLVLKSGVTGLADIRRAQFFMTPEECKSRSVLAWMSLFIVLAHKEALTRGKKRKYFCLFLFYLLKFSHEGKRQISKITFLVYQTYSGKQVCITPFSLGRSAPLSSLYHSFPFCQDSGIMSAYVKVLTVRATSCLLQPEKPSLELQGSALLKRQARVFLNLWRDA